MSNLAPFVGFSVYSMASLRDRALVTRVLTMLRKAPAFLVPRKYGIYAPLKERFDASSISSVAELLVGQQGSSNGLVQFQALRGAGMLVTWDEKRALPFCSVAGHVPLEIFSDNSKAIDSLCGFVRELVELLDPFFGRIENRSFKGWDQPLDFRIGLPEIQWVTILGRPYVDLFGKDRLVSLPVHSIEVLGAGQVWLQATPSVLEAVPSELQAAVRVQLGELAFRKFAEQQPGPRRIPDFKLGGRSNA